MSKKVFGKISAFVSETKTRSEESALLKKIEEGLKNKEFKMHLQFIVENKTKEIASAEALSRWETSEGQVVMPGKYISIMEKSGLISTFDYYMFERVCEKLARWKETEFSKVSISCNFTRLTISGKDFVEKIKSIADKYDFDRSKLQIEITEDSVEKNLALARENIFMVKRLGFPIALDDIGSGYTSLISLYEYHIDVAKIDREILLLANDERGEKLLFGIISLAHELGLRVVCEGVETEAQNELVSKSDCDYIQGWYYTKALPEDKAEEFAREYMKKL